MDKGFTGAMLELMHESAFCVENEQITHANQAARAQGFLPGSPITDYLTTGLEDYRAFTGGCLYLTLTVYGLPMAACVSRVDRVHIFQPEPEASGDVLQALALAARELRLPLSTLLAGADRVFPALQAQADPATQAQLAHMNRGLYQLLRLVSNMSDAARFASGAPQRMETRDVCALIAEQLDCAAPLAEECGVTLSREICEERIFSTVDPERLERALYNMLANAIKYSSRGGTVAVRLTHRGRKLYLSVENAGEGPGDPFRGNIHTAYLRPPSLEDGGRGIGLGMSMIRSAAAAHGGTVLLDQPGGTGTRVTMSLAICQDAPGLRSPVLRVDYAGERDHALMELSEVLPAESFSPEKLK